MANQSAEEAERERKRELNRQAVRRYKARNVEVLRERDREYKRYLRATFPERMRAYERERRKNLPPQKRAAYAELQRRWAKRNRERLRPFQRAASKRWWHKRGKKSRSENRETYNARMREWWAKHRSRVNAAKKIAKRSRLRTDMSFFLRTRLVARVHGGYRSAVGTGVQRRVRELLGCSFEELVEHIESKFAPGMSWENRSLWHIDHIHPLASFDLKDPRQQAKAFHFKNLQPLWGRENISKGRKIVA